MLGSLVLKVSVIEKGRTAEAFPEGQPVTNHKLLAEQEATEVLDHLAHDWPQHLYDGAVIDHILKVINIPRTDRTEITRRYRVRRAASDLAEGEAAGSATQRAIQGHAGDYAVTTTTDKVGEGLHNRPLTQKD